MAGELELEPEAQREPLEPPYDEAVDSASASLSFADHDPEVPAATWTPPADERAENQENVAEVRSADALIETEPPGAALPDLVASQAAPATAVTDTDPAEPAGSDPVATQAPVVAPREQAELDGDHAVPDVGLPESSVTGGVPSETGEPDPGPVPSIRLPQGEVGTPEDALPVPTAPAAQVEEPQRPSYQQPNVQPAQPDDRSVLPVS